MVSQKVTIKNPTGLHLRPAGILCKEAMQFKSHVTLQRKYSKCKKRVECTWCMHQIRG